VTYTAERALFLRSGNVARLVMSEGTALSYSTERKLLARVSFDDLTYDISDLISEEAAPVRADILPTWKLLNPGPDIRALERFRAGAFAAAGHERIVFGLHALLMPLLALGVMLTGGYQRRGFGKRIFGAVVAGVALVVAGLVVKSAVISDPGAWPLAYLPDLLAALLVLALLSHATQLRRDRRAAA
jgi:lipopolysaccharide export system permease protein